MADFNKILDEFKNPNDLTNQFDSQDIQNNKAMGILSYISWLVLIPLFAAKQSRFARFHCNQGLILAIVELITLVIFDILSGIPFIGWIFALVRALINIACFIFSVIGIINAANGQAKELPFIGKFRILK